MRAVFYATDEKTLASIWEIVRMLGQWGISASNADAVRFALNFTAEAHGLLPVSDGRDVDGPSQVKKAGASAADSVKVHQNRVVDRGGGVGK